MPASEFHLQRVGDLALVTLDNGEDWTKPTTLGEAALRSLEAVLDAVEREEWAGLVVTGKPFVFCAGADIDEFPEVTPERAREGSRAGHELFARLRALPFPTLAAINGACLGGGLELALHCDHRTISSSVRHFGAPEVFLGLFPAWGATQLAPRLVGAEAAVKVLVENPLRQNRLLDARQAHELGFVDAILEPVEFLDDSIAFLRGGRPERAEADLSDMEEAVRRARSRTETPAPAPYVCLDLIEGAARWSLDEGYRAEEEAIAGLLPGPEAQSSIYAFDLVERRAKRRRPAGRPRRVEKIGIVGAGLMASQIAALVLRRMEVPLVLRDLDVTIVDAALESIRGELAGQVAKGRLDEGKARFLGSIVSGGTGWDGFEDCDLVLEAVVERMDVKKEVFAELRARCAPEAVLATNTSSLSVAEMGADVGMHFFNPVPLMPLVELVRHEGTSDEALATVWAATESLKKRGVVVADTPGFVVNRILTRMTAALMDALEHGNTTDETDAAALRFGLPMAPSVLLQVVGPKVAYHTAETMHAAYPDRFPLSPTLRNYAEGRDEIAVTGDRRRSVEEIEEAMLEAMADEIRHMLAEGVVEEPADVDTCLILGAGFPFFRGGVTPYLRRRGLWAETAAAT